MKLHKSYITVLGLVALLGFTACGGGGSKRETPREIMSKKEGVIIFYGIPQKICESSDFHESMERKFTEIDLLFQVESNDVTCSTYGKKYPMCRTDSSYNYEDKSCVIGFDIKERSKMKKLSTYDEESLFEKIIIEVDEISQLMF
jgi:hypothetical protein